MPDPVRRGRSLSCPGETETGAVWAPPARVRLSPGVRLADWSAAGKTGEVTSRGELATDRRIVSTADATDAVLDWLRQRRFSDAHAPTGGRFREGSVVAGTLRGQVQFAPRPVEVDDLRELLDVDRSSEVTGALFFTATTYIPAAAEFADRADIGLFVYDFHGLIRPVNPVAARFVATTDPEPEPEPHSEASSRRVGGWALLGLAVVMALLPFLGPLSAGIWDAPTWLPVLATATCLLLAAGLTLAGIRRLRPTPS